MHRNFHNPLPNVKSRQQFNPVEHPDQVEYHCWELVELYTTMNTDALFGKVTTEQKGKVYDAFHNWLAILPHYRFGPIRKAVINALDLEGNIPKSQNQAIAFGIITALDATLNWEDD